MHVLLFKRMRPVSSLKGFGFILQSVRHYSWYVQSLSIPLDGRFIIFCRI